MQFICEFPKISEKVRKGTHFLEQNFGFLVSHKATSFYNPAGIYLFKINTGNTKAMCEVYSKLTINTPERSH